VFQVLQELELIMRQRRLTALTVLAAAMLVGSVAAPARAAAVDYVALGDSYSSGVGAPGTSGLCQRSPQGYPQLWAAAHAVASFRSVACGGAVTDDVRYLQVLALNPGTDLVTLTIGGNDVGFATAMITCTLGSTADCLAAVNQGRDYARTTLPGDLDATYANIRTMAPNAKVYVLGYPRLFEETATCSGGPGLTKRQAINQAADELSGIIADRAGRAGFRYVDARPTFAGHGICAATAWINPFGLSLGSFHPTAAGYRSGYLPALTAATG
jgi:lysophospholipase L1-like esterase